MGKAPFATVIIPSYNQASFLRQALDSLLSQIDSDWEAIVVNDGSTDHTRETAEEYARRDRRIRCIHKSNGGVASALNTGLENARGEWIHWLSSDDMFEPNKLAINRLWIGQYPDHNFFFSYFTLLTETTGSKERRELWGPLPDPNHQILTLFYRNYVNGISICVRRRAWEHVGFFDVSLRYAQDYDQWLRLFQKNQGVFIPEWTVISRNHAAQGSETFPDACYFDTAKAAIRFINQHPFQELVPWADLSDSLSAQKAVVYALEVAFDRTAFLYRLGYHPSLVARVLEWIFSPQCSFPALKALVSTRIAEMSFTEVDDDWGWMWRQLAVAISQCVGDFRYAPTDPVQLALREYRYRKICNGDCHEPLREYLIRFEGINPEDVDVLESYSPRLIILLDRHFKPAEVFEAAELLSRQGFRLLCLVEESGINKVSWQEWSWGRLIEVSAFDQNSLPWLGEVELAITMPGKAVPTWLDALFHLELSKGQSALDIERCVLEALGIGSDFHLRPVVFLERVLWGGGAERVVFDLARHLDRRRYRPIILTMFDEHAAPLQLPPHIETSNVRNAVDSADSQQKALHDSASFKPPARSRLISALHRIYSGLLPVEVRAKVRLGQRLVRLNQDLRTRLPKVRRRTTTEAVISAPQEERSPMDDGISLDYVNAAAHHNGNAMGVAKAAREIGGGMVLVSVMEEAAVTAWLAQGGCRFPYVVSLHSFESKCMGDIYHVAARRRAESRLLAAACNDALAVTFPTQGCCDDLSQNFAIVQENLRKIWNPVNCAAIRRQSFQPDAQADHWRETAPGFRMVHVGRLDPQKNHDLLLAVCVELKRRDQQFSLVIVGDGHDRIRIERLILSQALQGEVVLVGEQKNPFPWIAAADALLLTSCYESLSLVLAEAMVCGTPVVSVDCPSGPSEVLDKGEYGLLVANHNPIEFANAVERLMKDSSMARRMSDMGYKRAQDFDVKKIVLQWQALIDSVPQDQFEQYVH